MDAPCTSCGTITNHLHVTVRGGSPQLLCDRCYATVVQTTAPVCDFCSGGPVQWTYPAESHRVARDLDPFLVRAVSVDYWAACEACYRLIQADKWQRLAKRAATRSVKRTPRLNFAEVLHDTLTIHAKFREYRTGDPFRTPGHVGQPGP